MKLIEINYTADFEATIVYEDASEVTHELETNLYEECVGWEVDIAPKNWGGNPERLLSGTLPPDSVWEENKEQIVKEHWERIKESI